MNEREIRSGFSFIGAITTGVILRELFLDMKDKKTFFPNITEGLKPLIFFSILAIHLEEINKVIKNYD